MPRRLTAEETAALTALSWHELDTLTAIYPAVKAWRSTPEAPISDWNLEGFVWGASEAWCAEDLKVTRERIIAALKGREWPALK